MNNFPFFRFPGIQYNKFYPNQNYINKNILLNKQFSNDNFNKNTAQTPNLNADIKNINSNKDSKNTDFNISSKNLNIDNSKKEKKSSKYYNLGPVRFNFDSFQDCEEPIIEILGIKLYLDDIIILCLLFLLYKENVHDEGLFICLILLLLT